VCHTKFGPQLGPFRTAWISICLSVSELGEKNLDQLASHHCFVRALSSSRCWAMVAQAQAYKFCLWAKVNFFLSFVSRWVGPCIFGGLIFKLGNLKLELFKIPSSMPTSYVWLQGYGRMCMALAAERERERVSVLGSGTELNTQTPSDWRAVRIC
jgi:hypothetical protein